MGITISFGIQKGGVGKTTTTGIASWLMSKKAKVLAVDFDSQGNLTQLLTQKNVYDFTGRTILEACKKKDPRSYITPISDSLHLLPAEDLLATFSPYNLRKRNAFCLNFWPRISSPLNIPAVLQSPTKKQSLS